MEPGPGLGDPSTRFHRPRTASNRDRIVPIGQLFTSIGPIPRSNADTLARSRLAKKVYVSHSRPCVGLDGPRC
jgi:hypothetical protein